MKIRWMHATKKMCVFFSVLVEILDAVVARCESKTRKFGISFQGDLRLWSRQCKCTWNAPYICIFSSLVLFWATAVTVSSYYKFLVNETTMYVCTVLLFCVCSFCRSHTVLMPRYPKWLHVFFFFLYLWRRLINFQFNKMYQTVSVIQCAVVFRLPNT